jgi:hypothetical protein
LAEHAPPSGFVSVVLSCHCKLTMKLGSNVLTGMPPVSDVNGTRIVEAVGVAARAAVVMSKAGP